jgi:hypothetical protein
MFSGFRPDDRAGSIDGVSTERCGAFFLDIPESVASHSVPGAFTNLISKDSEPENTTSISFTAIVVKKIEAGGFSCGILSDALTAKATEYDATPGANSCAVTATVTVTEYVMVENTRKSRRRRERKTVPTQAFVY